MRITFSIIVPTLNRKSMLLEALASIRAQGWGPIEILVVDGGSTDGTVELLKTRPEVRLLEGPDDGVYDALNKGIATAQGDVIGLLNSDDAYEAGTFEAVAEAFRKSPSADAVCGKATLVENGVVIERYDRDSDKALTPRTCLIGSCVPNARFFRHTSIGRVGYFNTQYRYVADRDWLTRWYEAGLCTVPIPHVTYRYTRHPSSLTFWANPRQHTPMRQELLRLARRWRHDEAASAQTRRIAGLLEGRCLLTLTLDALKKFDLRLAGQLLLTENHQVSIAPAVAIARGALDVIFPRD